MDEVFKASNYISGGDADLPKYEEVENLYILNRENIIDSIVADYKLKEKDFISFANNPETHNRQVKDSNDFEMFLKSLDDEELKEFCEEFNYDCEEEPQEIFEWWAVSEYLFEKLKAKHEPVLEYGNIYIWGRTCTGQAILLDGVISEIALEMEILEGQKNEWKNL